MGVKKNRKNANWHLRLRRIQLYLHPQTTKQVAFTTVKSLVEKREIRFRSSAGRAIHF